MKKKSKKIGKYYRLPADKNKALVFIFILISASFSLSLFLSGCAKTGYPQSPFIKPPIPPKILSVKKLKGGLNIEYQYTGVLKGIKGFLIYKKLINKPKKKIVYSCNGSKPVAFQNLIFRKRFSLQYNNKFFYNVNEKDLKKGFYMFCAETVGGYGIKSGFSNYVIAHIILQK